MQLEGKVAVITGGASGIGRGTAMAMARCGTAIVLADINDRRLDAGSFLDYAIPSAIDVPIIQLGICETPSPTNPLGVKGIGELPTVAAPVAVANAVMDALTPFGVRHLDMPLTAEKIWSAMQRVSEGRC